MRCGIYRGLPKLNAHSNRAIKWGTYVGRHLLTWGAIPSIATANMRSHSYRVRCPVCFSGREAAEERASPPAPET